MALPTGIKSKNFYKYATDVVSGKIIAGELMKLSCNRFLSDLERDDLVFKMEIGDRFVEFCSIIKHFKGKSAGQNFKLEPWQEFIAYNILCWYWKETDIRRYTNSFICMARKQGKTALAALFCLWFLIADGEGSPECDLAANSRSQASIAFEFVEQYAKQLDPLQRELKIYRNGIKCELNVGKINVFSSDTSRLDGYNASFAIWDEGHSAKDSKMVDVLRSSMGQRKQPHFMSISTVGFDLSSPYYKMYQTNCEILHGLKTDDSTFIAIYQMDENDDWTDENNWLKCSPNLGVTVDKKYLREQVVQAKNNVSAEVGILTKNFNKWCSSSETWISQEYINKVTEKIDFNDFSDNDIAFAGIDLASTSDLTCVSFLLTKENDDKLYFKNLYYLPESALIESPNRELYKYWVRTKQLNITSGNVCDYAYILNDIMKMYNKVCIRKIGYDDWNAIQFVIEATENGLPMEPVSQSMGSLSRPTKTLERLIKKGDIVIDNNEINRFCFANATTKSDWNDNIKVIKGAGKDGKIDGVIAIIMALSVYLENPIYGCSITSI